MGILSEMFKLVAADGAERVIKGYQRSQPKAGIQTYNKHSAGLSTLPAKVDLRPQMTSVEDQGQTNSCTANATAGAFEYLFKRHQGVAQDVSRLYIYYNARYVADPDEIDDEGATISDVIDGLKQYGACTETTWVFDESAVNTEPEADAYDEGACFVVENARLVPVELAAWKTALAAGNPIIFGLELFDSFDKHRKPGLVPTPSGAEVARGTHAGHAMLCVGYSDPDEVFIVRNSWGTAWGDQGYCYIPYRYLMSPEYNDGDCWIIERVDELPRDEATWSDDDESVLEEAAHALAAMDEETYGNFLEAMGQCPFEQRLALIFLTAVGADGEVSDDELEVVKQYLEPVIEFTGGNRNAAGILKQARRLLADEDLLDESIDLIWEWFDYDVLAGIAHQIEEAAAADGLERAERKFIDSLIERWQAPADSEETDEDEDEDDDDDEEEEEEEDEEEDDEDEDEDDKK
ncbi:C1 family peptidase [uncultured Thiodictyon sp.]|uniref:C1 family peptidase n=1 Tax=uncultured Thiodictyon sp. TaxID=1846217 RepID=UPI0025EBBE5A|nr:C1 family peptidase [uncultured Thiodictyon sp.]